MKFRKKRRVILTKNPLEKNNNSERKEKVSFFSLMLNEALDNDDAITVAGLLLSKKNEKQTQRLIIWTENRLIAL